ncbi:MAG: hypothetical protein AABY15_09565 [Nanoarchaeota archaeon]
MKKIVFVFFVLSLLILSGCKESVTGKSVAEPEKKAEILDERISECVKACSDGVKPEEYFINSCSNILKYSKEEVFKVYVESCRNAK